MKKLIPAVVCVILFAAFIFCTGCKKSNNDPTWSEEDKASYQEAINLQDQAGDLLDEWFQTMDSLDAIQKVQQYFSADPSVSQSIINSQGIAVQYSNGMRGGIYLKPKDDISEVGEELFLENAATETESGLKSLVNQRKMILINPHYFERSYYTDQIYSITGSKLQKVGMELSTFYKNEEATIDKFTELSGYGIIQIYSHGWAWPDQNHITDVYLLTGETANEGSSGKYWDELKKGNIPVMKVSGPNKYLVSPQFIADHNDFSKDTVMFYGGFCYSFLGNWPDIVASFADGAYIGFDWSVYTHRNANWSVNSIALMCDTSLTQPLNLEDWMQDATVEKSYWNEKDSRTVEIHYTGDGQLTLWDDVSVRLYPLSSDGTPVDHPGEKGQAYSFGCEAITNVTPLEYVWNKGVGAPFSTDGNEIELSWDEDGTYELTVEVKNKSNGNLIGSAALVVKIGVDEVTEFVMSCNEVTVMLGPQSAFLWQAGKSGPVKGPEDMYWSVTNMTASGLGFTGTMTVNDIKNTISGTLSADGQKVSFTATRERYDVAGEDNIIYSITVADCPLTQFDPPSSGYGYAAYSVQNQDIQNYITSFEGREWNDFGYDYTLIGFKWAEMETLHISFNRSN